MLVLPGSYSPTDHATWATLYSRLLPRWHRFANPRYLHGLETLRLDASRIPDLDQVNRFLTPLTGFQATPVPGYVPAFVFFDCLRNRQFPTTVTIRDVTRLDYLPEPDIFHDIAGHVPMHTDPHFAEALVRFGDCAHTAAAIATSIGDPHDRTRTLSNIIRAMARFFWFTVEFGLMRGPGGSTKVYGSGLLSSYGEIAHAIESPAVQRFPLQLEWVINQPFEIDHYQPLLFIAESFEHVYNEVGRLEQWMRDGRLSNVAPGEPVLDERDVASFLNTNASATLTS